MARIYSLLLLLLLNTAFAAEGQDTSYSGLQHALRYTPWQLSFNPAGITRIPLDSLIEARIGYGYTWQPLSLSDQPDESQQYGASVDGYSRFGRLQLTGGLSWRQDLRKGAGYNYLLQPDYLVTAGDTLSNSQRVEKYRIYGKAAYQLTSRFTAGIGLDYTANDYTDDGAEKRFGGNAHTTALSTGLLYESGRVRMGLSAAYTRRTEGLSYSTLSHERLFTYPLGYYQRMEDFNAGEGGSSYAFRSRGNLWQTSLQAEWQANGRSYFHSLTAGYLKQANNPDKSGNMKGWDERFSSLEYRSRLTLPHGRWMHLISPSLLWKQGLSDRILQHVDPDSPSDAWMTYATYRFASRTETAAELRYEAIRDYSPTDDRQAWEVKAGWDRRKEQFYSFPLTIAQTIATLHGSVAYRYTFRLRGSSRLTLSPSFACITGYGTKEAISQEPGTPETELNMPRSYARVDNDYAARTATRLLCGLHTEYRRTFTHSFSAGLRLSGGFEQVTGNGTGGNIRVGWVCWL